MTRPIVELFEDDPDIQRLYENETFMDFTVRPQPVIVAARGVVRALEIVAFILLTNKNEEGSRIR